MRGTTVVFSILSLIVMGTNLMMNPWNLGMGEISISVGLPMVGVRFGILDFLEVGASTLARGGYVKLGFGTDGFALSGGYAAFPGITGFFAYTGVRFSKLEMAFGGVYYSVFALEEERDYAVEGEVHYSFDRRGNMENGVGLHVYHDSAYTDTPVVVSLYFDGTFHGIFFLDSVTLLGGLVLRIREGGFDPFTDMGVVVGVNQSFSIFKR